LERGISKRIGKEPYKNNGGEKQKKKRRRDGGGAATRIQFVLLKNNGG